MARGAREGKGRQRRPRKSIGRTGSPSAGQNTRTSTAGSSADQGGGGGRTLSIRTMKNPSTLVSTAKRVAEENGATFRGNTTSGSFSGKGVKGKYKIEGGTVKITITDKPALASWSTVESKVKEFFR
jgi:galactose mutarotase-like enzyme